MMVVLAATPVKLEEARARSRENTQVLIALLEARQAEQDVRQAHSALLPQVGFSTGASVDISGPQRFYNVVQDPETGEYAQIPVDVRGSTRPSFSLGLSLNQLLYDRAAWARLAQSGAQREAAEGEAREQAATSELEGIQRFFALYRSQASIQVLEANVRRSEEQLERARALFHAGRVGKGEELSAQVNLGNDRIFLVERRAQLAVDQGQLAVWLAMPGAEPLEAVEPGALDTLPPGPLPLAQALSEAKSRRPLLVALRERVRAAELGRQVASADYWPSLSLSASYGRGGPDPDIVFLQPGLQNAASAGLTLRWDIFSGFATDAATQRAALTQRIIALNLEQTERELEATVRQAHEALQAQLTATELAAENRKAAAGALVLAQERFNAGVGSTLEVRDAQLKLTQAELTLLENRIDVELARFALTRAMGTLGPGESQ
jgi:outer membrane protein TolC